MHVGLPKEIKVKENRVALTPGGVATLVRRGHRVTVERGAGAGSGLPDQEYEQAGATLGSAADAWGAEMVVKVKEPIESEYGYLRDDLLLFTYLHLAADRPLTARRPPADRPPTASDRRRLCPKETISDHV